MEVSARDRRWARTFLRGHRQPFQDVRRQYEFYLRNGYTEDFWRRDNLSYRNNECIGLWHCGFSAWRMSDPKIRRFLDWWYFEQLTQTTQDQISFPYVAQKLNIYPYSCPDKTFNLDASLRQSRHGE
jgi:hypothetical protein